MNSISPKLVICENQFENVMQLKLNIQSGALIHHIKWLKEYSKSILNNLQFLKPPKSCSQPYLAQKATHFLKCFLVFGF